jgi:hypothetical protein
MSDRIPDLSVLSRREFLRRSGMGMGALGLASVIGSHDLWTPAAVARNRSIHWLPTHRTLHPRQSG